MRQFSLYLILLMGATTAAVADESVRPTPLTQKNQAALLNEKLTAYFSDSNQLQGKSAIKVGSEQFDFIDSILDLGEKDPLAYLALLCEIDKKMIQTETANSAAILARQIQANWEYRYLSENRINLLGKKTDWHSADRSYRLLGMVSGYTFATMAIPLKKTGAYFLALKALIGTAGAIAGHQQSKKFAESLKDQFPPSPAEVMHLQVEINDPVFFSEYALKTESKPAQGSAVPSLIQDQKISLTAASQFMGTSSLDDYITLIALFPALPVTKKMVNIPVSALYSRIPDCGVFKVVRNLIHPQVPKKLPKLARKQLLRVRKGARKIGLTPAGVLAGSLAYIPVQFAVRGVASTSDQKSLHDSFLDSDQQFDEALKSGQAEKIRRAAESLVANAQSYSFFKAGSIFSLNAYLMSGDQESVKSAASRLSMPKDIEPLLSEFEAKKTMRTISQQEAFDDAGFMLLYTYHKLYLSKSPYLTPQLRAVGAILDAYSRGLEEVKSVQQSVKQSVKKDTL